MRRITAGLVGTLLLLAWPPAPAETRPQPPLVFRIGFWNNLHHFLYVLGRAQNHAPDAQRSAVVNAPAELEALAGRTDAERREWQAAVDFYAAGPSKEDAVFDKDTLVKETQVIAASRDDSDLSESGLPADLVSALRRAAPVYRAAWWPEHQRADEARRDELQRLVSRYGTAFVARLTEIYHAAWPDQPRVVNLSGYTNWAGAYSTDRGLIEFSSMDPAIGGNYGLEILFHESSHQWDEQMMQRLSSVARSRGIRVPDALSHAIVFYTAGAVVKEFIPEHIPYAEKFGNWNRGSFRGMKPILDEYWLPYLQGHGTIDEALASLMTHMQ
jgi:hypothetical protein